MKAHTFVSALCMLIVATLMTGCNSNPPQTEALGDKSLIAGTWNVTGGTRRYNPGDGYTTEKMSTARVRDFICTCWLFDYEKGTAQQFHLDPTICDFNSAAFTLEDCAEGYKLVIEKLFVEDPNMGMSEAFRRWENDEPVYNSYITVTKLTEHQMEWDFVSGYGGDEGPDYFHVILEK